MAISSRKDVSLKAYVSQSELINFPVLPSKQLAKRCFVESLCKPIRTHPFSNPPIKTVGEKMLHRKPNASQSELMLFPILPQHNWRKDAPWKPYWKPIKAHPSSNPSLITIGEKMLHGNPNGSQSELIHLPILTASQLAKRCFMETLMEANQSSSIFQSSPHHSWQKDAPWKP